MRTVPDYIIERIVNRKFFTHLYLCGSPHIYLCGAPLANNYEDGKPVYYSLSFVSNADVNIELDDRIYSYKNGSTLIALLTHDRWYVTDAFVSIITAHMSNLIFHVENFAIVDKEALEGIKEYGLVGYLKRKTR